MKKILTISMTVVLAMTLFAFAALAEGPADGTESVVGGADGPLSINKVADEPAVHPEAPNGQIAETPDSDEESASAGAARDAQISVTGDATLQIPADMATVRLGVMESAQDVLEAQSSMNTKIDSIRKALIESGVDEKSINTDGMNIYTNYSYGDDGSERVASYTASSTLSIVTEDIDGVGAIIDKAFAAGANTLNGIDFSVKDSTEVMNQAYLEAMKNARFKAELLASAEGVSVGSVKSIAQGNSYTYDSMSNYVRYAAETSDAGAGTFVQAALIDVKASVSVVYELK